MKAMTLMSIRTLRYSSDPTSGLSKAYMFAMSAGGSALFLEDEEPRFDWRGQKLQRRHHESAVAFSQHPP